MFTVNLVSRENGVGLSTDMELLQGFLSQLGGDVQRVDWTSRHMRPCDVAIFLELFNPRLTRYARNKVGLFNLEWFLPGWKHHLPRFTQLWAKSQDAHEAYQQLGLNSHLTGFLTRDLYDHTVPRTATCLHLRGHSSQKNTDTVLKAWESHPNLPPLTIVSADPLRVPPGVTVLPRMTATGISHQLNTHRIHVCPSKAEGWGHYITEGMSTGALVITTDAPPMNEHIQPDWGILVPPVRSGPRGMVREHLVDPDDLADAVRWAFSFPSATLGAMSHQAICQVWRRNDMFALKVIELLGELGCV